MALMYWDYSATEKWKPGSGEIVEQLHALTTLAEDTGLGLSTHMVANNPPQLQFQGIRLPLLVFSGTAYMRYTLTHARKIPKHVKFKLNLKKRKTSRIPVVI